MIDKIGYSRPITTSRTEAKRRSGSVGASAFSDMLDALDSTQDAEPVASAAPVMHNGALLGLQEVSDEEVSRKRALKQGRNTLDTLEQIRDGLLSGSLPIATIRQLESQLAAERATVIDPRLQAILDDIEVRAAVELAKLERAQAQKG